MFLGVLIGLSVGVGGGVFAVSELLAKPEDVLESPNWAIVEAKEDVVGQSLHLNAAVQWQQVDVITGSSSGIVTEIAFDAGSMLEEGAILYSVDLRPTVAIRGSTPSFRDLRIGLAGDDVQQLQEFLIASGFLTGDADGTFGRETDAAVRRWHRSLGVAAGGHDAGTVLRSDVVYIPTLPVRATPGDGLRVGAPLPEGSEVAKVFSESPQFTVELSDSQVALVTPGCAVTLNSRFGMWGGVVDSVFAASNGEAGYAVLGSLGPNPICGDDCASLPVDDPVVIAADVVIVPEQTGIVVPVAAIVTTAGGETGVILEDDSFREVDLVASARGSAVVNGLDEGTKVRVPGDTQ